MLSALVPLSPPMASVVSSTTPELVLVAPLAAAALSLATVEATTTTAVLAARADGEAVV